MAAGEAAAKRMPKKLSDRLKAVAAMVPKGAYLADIGSDHAWLPISLIESGKIEWAMAIDNKMGPFLRMRDNVANSPKAANRILCLKSDGISEITESINTLAICGVGGILACQMLEAHPEKLVNVSTIIVDPHRDLLAVRKRVCDLGYHIADEEMVYEDHVFYSIIRFALGKPAIPYTNNELAFGPVLMKKGGPVYASWLLAQKEKLKKILNSNLPKEQRERYLRTYRAVSVELSKINNPKGN